MAEYLISVTSIIGRNLVDSDSNVYQTHPAEGSRRTTFDFLPIDKVQAYNPVEVMEKISAVHDVTVAQMAWVRLQPGVASKIIGAKTLP
ncbi:hypothetical protein GCM10009119_19030 [Algoriphagus jejuensis]|uniref:Uncharacterized protein n=1 Tax=Algoriphagus jejuensis TaxID=419934 RepID=A0ABP3YC43_9BACT